MEEEHLVSEIMLIFMCHSVCCGFTRSGLLPTTYGASSCGLGIACTAGEGFTVCHSFGEDGRRGAGG